MGGLTPYSQPEEPTSRWRPIVIAAVIVALIGVLIWFASRKSSSAAPQPAAEAPYAANLKISNLHLSTAENFVGGRVTYLEGTIANTGDQTVTGAQVETIFRNMLGEIVDRQTQPLRVASSPLGNPDWVALSIAPLVPNKTATFRLTFEHISADWNQGYPELKFVSMTTR